MQTETALIGAFAEFAEFPSETQHFGNFGNIYLLNFDEVSLRSTNDRFSLILSVFLRRFQSLCDNASHATRPWQIVAPARGMHLWVIRVGSHDRVRSVLRRGREDFAMPMVDDVHGARHIGPGETIKGFAFRMDAA